MALKKNVRSSLVHTTDHGVPGTATLDIGRGPFGSSVAMGSVGGVGSGRDCWKRLGGRGKAGVVDAAGAGGGGGWPVV